MAKSLQPTASGIDPERALGGLQSEYPGAFHPGAGGMDLADRFPWDVALPAKKVRGGDPQPVIINSCIFQLQPVDDVDQDENQQRRPQAQEGCLIPVGMGYEFQDEDGFQRRHRAMRKPRILPGKKHLAFPGTLGHPGRHPMFSCDVYHEEHRENIAVYQWSNLLAD